MAEETKEKGQRPDYRIVQFNPDQDSTNDTAVSVGGMWRNKSKAGKDYLNIKIGGLSLIGFPTEQKGDKKPPAFNVCQRIRGEDGKTDLKQVGALWDNTSKDGKHFLTLMMGDLRLVCFLNDGPMGKGGAGVAAGKKQPQARL